MGQEKNSFRTLISSIGYPFLIDHATSIACLGSCFAAHMAEKLEQYKFNVLLNPFGIAYHPLAIAKGIEDLLTERVLQEDDLFEDQGLWHSFDFHSHFSHPNQKLALDGMNRSLATARDFISNTNVLIVTLGTATVFHHLEAARLVTNCHKLPAQQFERRRLTVEEIVKGLQLAFSSLKKVCGELEIVLTVSPVRHIKDGIIENQRSKAALLLAVDQLQAATGYIHYFPAYEIMMDDLRDYRFYEADLVHPNDLAIDYIWEHFQNALFSPSTQQLHQQIHKLVQASRHRPFHPDTPAHQQFVQQQLGKLKLLTEKHPHLDFSKEEKHFKTALEE